MLMIVFDKLAMICKLSSVSAYVGCVSRAVYTFFMHFQIHTCPLHTRMYCV